MGSNRVTVGTQLPAGTNNIGDVDVLTLPALPAGSNAIGKLAANSGVDIGDVDVTSLPAITGTVTANAGTNLNTSGLLTDTQLRATAVPVSLAAAPTTAITAAALPLPSGASTAAKQPALGTAGTASADVITVQGIAAGYLIPVGLRQTNISQTPTVSTTPAYTIGDALGGLLTFANAARVSGSSGLVLAATVMCKTPALVPIIDLYLFNQTFTAIADNAAFNPSDGDMANCIGVITISNWAAETASSLNSIATWRGVHPFLLTGTSLFGQMVIRTSVTAAGTTDFVIGLQVAQD